MIDEMSVTFDRSVEVDVFTDIVGNAPVHNSWM